MCLRHLAILVLVFLSAYGFTNIQHAQAQYTVTNCQLPDCILVGMTSVPNFLFLAPRAVQTNTGNPQDFEARPLAVILFYNNDTSFHTATSGTGLSDPESGKAFDSRLMRSGDLFQWQVPPTTGIQPYYCIPHVVDGMIGKITIKGQPIPEIRGQYIGFTLVGALVLSLLVLARHNMKRIRRERTAV